MEMDLWHKFTRTPGGRLEAAGVRRGDISIETGVIPPLTRLGRGILIPSRTRAFWADAGLSCALPGHCRGAMGIVVRRHVN